MGLSPGDPQASDAAVPLTPVVVRPEDLAGTVWHDLLTPASRAVVCDTIDPALRAAGRSHGTELDIVTKDGTVLPVVHSATLMLDREGRFRRAFAIFFDNRETVDARRKLGESVREALAQDRSALIEMPVSRMSAPRFFPKLSGSRRA